MKKGKLLLTLIFISITFYFWGVTIYFSFKNQVLEEQKDKIFWDNYKSKFEDKKGDTLYKTKSTEIEKNFKTWDKFLFNLAD